MGTADPSRSPRSCRSARLDELFSSRDPKEIQQFFRELTGPEDYIQFATTRARARVVTHRFNIDRAGTPPELVAVVPTADVTSPLARTFVRSFSPLPIIVAESRGQHFNFSVSMNVGLSEAIRLGAGAILFSNDDVSPASPVSTILDTVRQLRDVDVLVPKLEVGPIRYSGRFYLLEENGLTRLPSRMLRPLAGAVPRVRGIVERFRDLDFPAFTQSKVPLFYYEDEVEPTRGSVYRDFAGRPRRLTHLRYKLNIALHHHRGPFYRLQPVSIIRTRVLRSRRFDENFINGGEDRYLSMSMSDSGVSFRQVPLEFRTPGGVSLGHDSVRFYRGHSEHLYLGWILQQEHRKAARGPDRPDAVPTAAERP